VSDLTTVVMGKAIISMHIYFKVCKVMQSPCWSVIDLHQLRIWSAELTRNVYAY